MTKLEAVYTWLKTYSGFKNLDFNFGISKNNNSVLIPAPNDYVVYEDITGTKIRHLTFSVSNYKHLSNLESGSILCNIIYGLCSALTLLITVYRVEYNVANTGTTIEATVKIKVISSIFTYFIIFFKI